MEHPDIFEFRVDQSNSYKDGKIQIGGARDQ